MSDLSDARTVTVSGETSGDGTVEFDYTDSIFNYNGTCDQTIFSGTYNELVISEQIQQKHLLTVLQLLDKKLKLEIQ